MFGNSQNAEGISRLFNKIFFSMMSKLVPWPVLPPTQRAVRGGGWFLRAKVAGACSWPVTPTHSSGYQCWRYASTSFTSSWHGPGTTSTYHTGITIAQFHEMWIQLKVMSCEQFWKEII
jgi:hypothetical protein